MVGTQIIVSERVTDARGAVSYQAVLELAADGHAVATRFAPDIGAQDLRQCREVVAQMQIHRHAMRGADPCDFLALHHGLGGGLSPVGLRLQRLWADYATALGVYSGVADAYLAQPAPQRVSPELSLDLYRQTLGFHDLARARRFLAEDGPVLRALPLSAHHRECIHDVFFHLARRLGDRRAAYGYLQQAWLAHPNPDRAQILIADAGLFQLSQDVITYAAYLSAHQPLAPQQLAQLAVAYARSGEMAKAKAILRQLATSETEEARRLAPKIAAFLKAQAGV